MNCWIHLFSVCLFDPSNVSVDADVSSQIAGKFFYQSSGREYPGAIVGRLQLSVAVPVTRDFTITYGLEHRSLVNITSDRGEERVVLGFTWRPFR